LLSKTLGNGTMGTISKKTGKKKGNKNDQYKTRRMILGQWREGRTNSKEKRKRKRNFQGGQKNPTGGTNRVGGGGITGGKKKKKGGAQLKAERIRAKLRVTRPQPNKKKRGLRFRKVGEGAYYDRFNQKRKRGNLLRA